MDSVTYVSLNLIVMACLWLVLHRHLREPRRTYRIMLTHLLIMTLVFDSLIVAAGIVAYDDSKLLGLRLITAPIEDFFYTITAVFLIPAVWRLTQKGSARVDN